MIIAPNRTGILPRPVRSKPRPTFVEESAFNFRHCNSYWGNGLCARCGIPCHGLIYSSSNHQGNGFLQCELLESLVLVLRKNSEASSMSMPPTAPMFKFLVFCICPGSANAQYLTVSSSIARDPFFKSAFSLPTKRVIQKHQGTPCTPRQCRKQPNKVQRPTPASIFGGII